MKIYVHYEVAEPEFTLPVVLDVSDARTAGDLKREFVEAYNRRHGAALDPGAHALTTSKKKQLMSGDSILSACKANADLFLIPRAGGKPDPKPARAAPKAKPHTPAAEPPPAAARPSPTPAAQPSVPKPTPTPAAPVQSKPAAAPAAVSAAAPAKAAAKASAAKGQQQPAKSAASGAGKKEWERPNIALMTAPPQVTKWVAESLQLARTLKVKRSLRQACEAWRQILAVSPGCVECLDGMAQVAADSGRHDEAIDLWSQAVAVSEKQDPELYASLGKVCLNKTDYMGALVFLNRAIEAKVMASPQADVDDLKVLVGKALYASGNRDAAIQVLTNILQKNEGHTGALLEYAKAYRDRGLPNNAIQILLRVLVQEASSKDARALISEIVKSPGGLDVICTELGEASKSGPALAFMATLIKDYGAVEESVALYYKALESAPHMTTYVLNLVHTLEVCNRYQEAIDLAVKYCREQKAMHVGGHYSNEDVAKVMEDIGDVYDAKYRDPAHPGNSKVVFWVPNLGSVVRDRSDKTALPDPNASTALPSPAAPLPDKSEQKIPPYTPDELDLLALHFTMVKILYVTGAIARIPALVEVIEVARQGWDMHVTTIRNEHAYYCCVTQLFCDIPYPFPTSPDLDVIHMAGDSHSLSSAWQVITVKGRQTQMMPRLVTGLKCFHLRPESVFFPKNNFYNVVEKIPKGSKVVFMFGEIDCREGILMAVEKGRYRDLDEGISTTIDYYLNVLESLASRFDFTIYVQPVPPVLNETREVVKLFNAALKTKVGGIASLTFLDFLDGLLTDDKKLLRKEYEMDGTHMSPEYVKLVEKSLNELP